MITINTHHQIHSHQIETILKSQIERDSTLCLTTLFAHQAQQPPNQIAVVCQNQQLTYDELNHRANQVAHYLRQRGVTAEQLVGWSLKPSLAMVIGKY